MWYSINPRVPPLFLIMFRCLNIVSLNLEIEIGTGIGIDISSNVEKVNYKNKPKIISSKGHVNAFIYEFCK